MSQQAPDLGDFSPLLDEQLRAGQRGDFDRGSEIARELAAKFPNSHRAAFNRAWYEMREGRLLKGLECLDRGRWVSAFGAPALATTKPIYRNESLEGKHLLLRSEGGLGDEIINVRFAKDFAAKGARVTVSAAPSLMSALARVEGIAAVVANEAAAHVFHDYWVPAMSAARVLGCEFRNLNGQAYLTADPLRVQQWRPYVEDVFASAKDNEPRIGLKFFGNPKFEHEQLRRFPPQLLVRAVGERPWLNLQLEDSKMPIRDWDDTLAILSQLDLVITSCTSVAHASAALGIETWIVTPILPYYIWALPGEKTPWYDSVTLFRQQQPDRWDETFASISQRLDQRFPK